MFYPSHPPQSFHPNNVWQGVELVQKYHNVTQNKNSVFFSDKL
jgi:hypothetical protein